MNKRDGVEECIKKKCTATLLPVPEGDGILAHLTALAAFVQAAFRAACLAECRKNNGD